VAEDFEVVGKLGHGKFIERPYLAEWKKLRLDLKTKNG
jgi:hypothetical protein